MLVETSDDFLSMAARGGVRTSCRDCGERLKVTHSPHDCSLNYEDTMVAFIRLETCSQSKTGTWGSRERPVGEVFYPPSLSLPLFVLVADVTMPVTRKTGRLVCGLPAILSPYKCESRNCVLCYHYALFHHATVGVRVGDVRPSPVA